MFFVGCLVGCIIGFAIAAWCASSQREDMLAQEMHDKYFKKKGGYDP